MTTPDPHFDSLLPAMKLDRRGFVAGLLATGFAAAVAPALAQTAIHTDAEGLTVGEIQVPVADGTIPAYRAQPATGGPFPVVLVVHEIFGVHEYIKDVCRRLAKVGYQAIAPEMYVRQGDVSRIPNIQDILPIVAKAPDSQHMSDLDACAAWAAKHGGDPARLGITGYCRGGRTVWLYAAHNPRLKAAVAWYGALEAAPTALQPKNPIDLAGEIRVPVLGLYGGKDQGITPDQVEDMRDALKKAGAPSEIHVYPDAGHAFHADYRPTYRKDAAEDGWRRMLAWFREHGLS